MVSSDFFWKYHCGYQLQTISKNCYSYTFSKNNLLNSRAYYEYRLEELLYTWTDMKYFFAKMDTSTDWQIVEYYVCAGSEMASNGA